MRGAGSRQGFTLIELLVVIAIIAILMALVSAAVFKVLGMGPELEAQSEIRQMGVGITNFQKNFNMDKPPPSLLFLSNKRSDYNTDSSSPVQYRNLRKASLAFLSKMFPRNTWPATLNWTATNGVVLEGDQCLVWLLGGPDGTSGFSTDPSNPTATTSTRKGPFYEFKTARLKPVPVATSGTGYERSATAPSYFDPFGKQPYLYFSSGNRNNGYNLYVNATDVNEVYGSDCKAANVVPYRLPGAQLKYYNSSTYQIISGGANGRFGSGGPYDAGNPNPPADGRDDFSNFHGGRLEAAE